MTSRLFSETDAIKSYFFRQCFVGWPKRLQISQFISLKQVDRLWPSLRQYEHLTSVGDLLVPADPTATLSVEGEPGWPMSNRWSSISPRCTLAKLVKQSQSNTSPCCSSCLSLIICLRRVGRKFFKAIQNRRAFISFVPEHNSRTLLASLRKLSMQSKVAEGSRDCNRDHASESLSDIMSKVSRRTVWSCSAVVKFSAWSSKWSSELNLLHTNRTYSLGLNRTVL